MPRLLPWHDAAEQGAFVPCAFIFVFLIGQNVLPVSSRLGLSLYIIPLTISVVCQLVIVFRGTETNSEWIENATVFMEQLDGEPPESGLALIFNRSVSHVGEGRHARVRGIATCACCSPKPVVDLATVSGSHGQHPVQSRPHEIGTP